MKRPIAISLSPNVEKDDFYLAVKLFTKPVGWFDFRQTEKLEIEFARYFGRQYKALAVNSGRSALYLILKSLGMAKYDKVALQALTCVVVPNSIIFAGQRPLYVDIDENYNLSADDLKKKITKDTRAVILQHTFGTPAEINKISREVERSKLILIEDCAISLGAKYEGKKVGTFGKVSFFSFGRDKVISSVFGGIILTKDKKIYETLKKERDKLPYPPFYWVIQQLLHPIIMTILLPFYNLGFGKFTIGKIALFVMQKLKILSKAVDEKEKESLKTDRYLFKLPGVLAVVALHQFHKLDVFNDKRKDFSNRYFKSLKDLKITLPAKRKGAIWHRFPILSESRNKFYETAKKKGILLGDWYKSAVFLSNDLDKVGYRKGSCPNAEKISKKILNLPTYPTMSLDDIEKVIQTLKDVKV